MSSFGKLLDEALGRGSDLSPILYKISSAASRGKMPFDMPRASLTALLADLGLTSDEAAALRSEGLLARSDEGVYIDKVKFDVVSRRM